MADGDMTPGTAGPSSKPSAAEIFNAALTEIEERGLGEDAEMTNAYLLATIAVRLEALVKAVERLGDVVVAASARGK
jgi:hypothetical protein